jgi:uncharacterized alpha-E superfamily protein
VISRVAESCFWLFRHVERAESCARLVAVNRLIVLDAQIGHVERWKPVIVVVGEQARFEELVGAEHYRDDDVTEEYLTWSEESPVSIRSCLYWARENARMTREAVSREMWETLNTWWQWFNGKGALREYRKDRSQFYQRIRSMCAEFQGVSEGTMLHEEPFDFMLLGMALERANQTARLMDVKYHRIGTGETERLETPWQSAEWVSQLKLCAAEEPFFKRNRAAPTGRSVAAFLLQEPNFPRSVLHCLERAVALILRVQAAAGRNAPSASFLATRALLDQVRSLNISSVLQSGLHQELTRVVDTVASVCVQLNRDFFDPSADLAAGPESDADAEPETLPGTATLPRQHQLQQSSD